MRRGTKVAVRMEAVSDEVKSMMSDFQKFNNATVSKWNKASQRIQIKWFNQSPMWFDIGQVKKVI